MDGSVLSTNAAARPGGAGSGIHKRPVPLLRIESPTALGALSGVEGDHVGNGRHHGGEEKAVYAFSAEELGWWARELGRDLEPGIFGENLTTQGVAIDDAVMESTWRIGSALLQVSWPRLPCATFARHMDEQRWVQRFSARARVGTYFRVLEPGEVRAGDRMAAQQVPAHGVTVSELFRARMGDTGLARRALDGGFLRPERVAEFERVAHRAK